MRLDELSEEIEKQRKRERNDLIAMAIMLVAIPLLGLAIALLV
jgi:predicted nucleic acid-binding Zn ribbon protein